MRIEHFLSLGLAWIASLFATAGPARAEPSTGVEWESIAKEFLSSHGLAQASPESVELDAVLRAHFAHTQLGLFDVWFPAAAAEKRGDDFRQCAAALVDAQDKWLDWLKASGKEPKGVRDDLRAVSTWVKSWKLASLSKAKNATTDDLVKVLGANDTTSEAHARFAESMGRCESLGVARDTPLRSRILLLPTRKDFVQLVAFAGWLWPERRNQYWVDGGLDWMQCFLGADQAIALEYAQVNRKPGDYAAGTAMNDRDSTVMQQQVVQLGMNSLFSELFGDRLPPAFASGFSMNLVIDQFGEVNTRVDGDVRSRATQAHEVFVPGGQSQGGVISNSADSRWRVDKGKDRYVHVLHVSQKDGEALDKKAKNRQACFALRNGKGESPIAVVGPFIGAAAAATAPPPAEYTGDFAEMLRAYKCAFLYWLRNEAAGNRKSSQEKFVQLLQKLADPKESLEFEPILCAVFDKTALSGPDVDHATLEGKFLSWLVRQK